MKKTDIHLTFKQHPKTGQMFVSSAEHMLPHLRELSIEKGILMSSRGSGTLPFHSEVTRSADRLPQPFRESISGCAIWMNIQKIFSGVSKLTKNRALSESEN